MGAFRLGGVPPLTPYISPDFSRTDKQGVWGRYAPRVAYKLAGDGKPKIDAFPVDFSYGSGITLAEITLPTTDVTLSSNYFTDERVSQAKSAICAAGERFVGVVNDPAVLEYMLNFASAELDQDPFLTAWEKNEVETPAESKTFAGIFLSNWSTVHDDVQASFAHDLQQPSHFYVVIRDSLPDEVCDQLRHVVRYRSQVGAQTWKDLVAAEEFQRAREMAKNARRYKLDRICNALGVVYDDGRVSDTCTDFVVAEKNELNVPEDSDNVFFYSGCSSSLEVGPGRAILANNNSNPPEVLWLHGPPNGRLGGGQWRWDENLSAFPEVINTVTEENIGALVASGWDVTNGFVHMSHLATVHQGEATPYDPNENV